MAAIVLTSAMLAAPSSTLRIDSGPAHALSPLLYSLFFETEIKSNSRLEPPVSTMHSHAGALSQFWRRGWRVR